MAQIVINEISQNYTYNIGRNSFATVALPITASWGPAYTDPDTPEKLDEMLETTSWTHFPATQAGLETFVSTYRGPVSNYRLAKDFSYQMAMTLLTAGYDVLTCRVCPGDKAEASFTIGDETSNAKTFSVKAKYPGSFGNNLKVVLSPVRNRRYWNLVVYVVDSSGIQSAVENLVFVFEEANSTDSILHIDEIESNFLTFASESGIMDPYFEDATNEWKHPSIVPVGVDDSHMGSLDDNLSQWVILSEGSDITDFKETNVSMDKNQKQYVLTVAKPDDWDESWNNYFERFPDEVDPTTHEMIYKFSAPTGGSGSAPEWEPNHYYREWSESTDSDEGILKNLIINCATSRYTSSNKTLSGISLGANLGDANDCEYLLALNELPTNDKVFLNTVYYREWCYSAAFYVYQLLKDKLNYNPQRIISPGWDDQDICFLTDGEPVRITKVSPLHKIIMETAYYSRCAAGMIDIPRSCARSGVYDDSVTNPGYVQLLSRAEIAAGGTDVNAILYTTHSALFAPWRQYKYVGTGKQNIAPPAFLALLVQRAQILNQSLQYEWALPTNRKHNLMLGKSDYKVPKKLLDIWQKLTGVGVNVLTEIPDLGVNLWGNSTLYEVPPATYQALANLSTRYLVNAVENVAYRCGISITYQYNNEQAYNKFYAGVTPTLDTMKNVGAIDDYYVKMAADINGLDQVNANTVIGKIYLVINGVINDIIIDLIALPPGTDLNQYKS